MTSEFDWVMLIPLLTAGVRLASPLIFAALGGIFSERSGVINIGLEGMMIAGTFGAYLGAFLLQNPLGGVAGGVLAGALLGWLFAVLCIRFRADQVVLGTAVNIFALGLTSFFFRAMYRAGIPASMPSFGKWPLPGLSNIPVVGEIFFNQVPLVYLAYVLVPLAALVLFRTTWGLKLRGVGEHPLAASTAGIHVLRVRYMAVILSGALAGLGGAFLSIGELSSYAEGLVAGRGFIALAAVIFGGWHPLRSAIACLLFGTADALQLRLQSMGLPIPYEFLLMFPYVLTLVTFVFFAGKASAPAALGKPYSEK